MILLSTSFSLGTEESDSEEAKLKGHTAGDEKKEGIEQMEGRYASYVSVHPFQEISSPYVKFYCYYNTSWDPLVNGSVLYRYLMTQRIWVNVDTHSQTGL